MLYYYIQNSEAFFKIEILLVDKNMTKNNKGTLKIIVIHEFSMLYTPFLINNWFITN